MNKKRFLAKEFSFIWNGLIHLSDGSRWTLADPAREHDVTWWQTGDVVKIARMGNVMGAVRPG
jgi:hypothetical protein